MMIPYNQAFISSIDAGNRKIKVFTSAGNIDKDTVESFGDEWSTFHTFNEDEIYNAGDNYFDILPVGYLTKQSHVLDVGCGTGRWTYYLADKVGNVECIDPSKAVLVASKLLASKDNVRISQASVDNIPFEDNSFDLVFSLGVLHHVPDTKAAVKKCAEKVKPGGYLLLYLYYNLENRGLFFKTLFHLSNSMRWGISKLPSILKNIVCDVLAVLIYMPFVLLSRFLIGLRVSTVVIAKIPLSWYADKSFNIIRNDSLDRFGTPLEQRFSKAEITHMLEHAGCTNIVFADNAPFWRAIAQKK
ncbi:MAG: class I SAM-dependent methyltransferase [Cytophaga sp.]|uniref:class I SAM-dependent methyltransferase n=1 Tax=Cytophaga sp. TaxID=29535 RepID=UPI003F7E313E